MHQAMRNNFRVLCGISILNPWTDKATRVMFPQKVFSSRQQQG
jgi:hypothetical protein